jgi:hypothetical protein
LETLGLIIILIAWLIQALYTNSKTKKLNPLFVIFYAIGSLLLVVSAYNHDMFTPAILNLSCFVAAIIVLWKTTY